MSGIITTTIAITQEPEAQTLKQKLSPRTNPEALRPYSVVLEYTRDEMRSMLFLSLYMPSQLIELHGGIQKILTPPEKLVQSLQELGASVAMPQLSGDDVLTEHGMRLNLQQLDPKEGALGFEGHEKLTLSSSEMSAVRSALAQLLSQEEGAE